MFGARIPVLSYLICTTPRTGSELLCEILTRTKVTGFPGEHFYPERFPNFFQHYRVSSFEEYYRIILNERTTPNGVFGTKTMTGGVLYPFLELVRRIPPLNVPALKDHEVLQALFPNLRYIFLTRRDKVSQAISHWRAIESDQWHSVSTRPDAPPKKRPQFNFEAIDHLQQEIVLREVKWQEFFQSGGVKPLTLVYEDFIQDQEGAARQVLEFLSLSPQPGWYLENITNQKVPSPETEEWLQRYRQLKQSGWQKVVW